MNVMARVTAFTVALVALGGAAAAVGVSVGPVDTAAPTDHEAHPARDGSHGAADAAAAIGAPAGLQVSEQGHTLRFLQDHHQPSADQELRLQILDESGHAVTQFETEHGKPLHLILVRRDLGSFQHVHPEMSPDGTWSVDVDLTEAGTYRAFADFRTAGADTGLTLGQDLFVTGRFVPRPLPTASASSRAGEYDVELAGSLVPGETSRLTLTVTRGGEPVTNLQPYLEAYGHLVALRVGDLAYLHVHPDGAPGDDVTPSGPEITFDVEVPSAGAYRLFLDFKHEDEVRTAAFTAIAGPGPAASPGQPSEPSSGETHTH